MQDSKTGARGDSQGSPSEVKEVRSTPQCKVEVKEAVRMGLKKQKVRPKEGCVFVGNLHPASRESELRELFRPFGSIKEVSIGVLSGDVANYMALGDRASIESTRIYATICYWNFLNANKAKDAMNGVVYRGLPLAVTRHMIDLPEYRELVEREKARIEGTAPQPAAIRKIWNTLRTLTVDRTLILEGNDDQELGYTSALVEAERRALVQGRDSTVPLQAVTRSQARTRRAP